MVKFVWIVKFVYIVKFVWIVWIVAKKPMEEGRPLEFYNFELKIFSFELYL